MLAGLAQKFLTSTGKFVKYYKLKKECLISILKNSNKVYCLTLIILFCLLAVVGKQREQLEKRKQEIEWKKIEIHQLQNDVDVIRQEIEKIKTDVEGVKQAKAQSLASAQKTQQKASTQATTQSVEQWRPLCAKYFPEQTQSCLTIMKYESGGNPMAYSKTSDAGLMQINTPTWNKFFGVTTDQLFDPETNMKCARVIYDRAGSWNPWTTSKYL